MQIPYWTAGHKPAFYVLLGSNQSLRLKQCGTIRLGKSAHPNPLLVLAFLSLCVCFPFWICRQDYISSVILRSHLNQSCWKYLICFLNHDSDSLLLKAAGGGRGGAGRERRRKFGTINPFYQWKAATMVWSGSWSYRIRNVWDSEQTTLCSKISYSSPFFCI